MRVLLPYDDVYAAEPVPPDVTVAVWPGEGAELPSQLDEIELWVPPYLGSPRSFAVVVGKLPALRIVQALTAGVDNLRPHVPDGVLLCNARGVHDASTAELAVALMLAAQRGIPDFVRDQAEGRWDHSTRPSLADRTVLLVGYGSIGAAVERRLAGFEVDVVRVARTERDGVASFADLPALLPAADIVVLTVPLTDETRGMVDASFLAAMKDDALLINVARGGIVDTAALMAELRAGRLRAALDVTDPEPLPPDHELWRLPGVLVVPHVGGDSTAFLPRAHRLIRDQVRRVAAGQPPINVVEGAY